MAFNGTLNLAAMEPLLPVSYVGAGIGGSLDLNTTLGLAVTASTPFRKLRLVGATNYQSTPNQGTVWAGWSSLGLPLEILPGEAVEIVAPMGTRLDLKDIQLGSTIGTDSVVATVWK